MARRSKARRAKPAKGSSGWVGMVLVGLVLALVAMFLGSAGMRALEGQRIRSEQAKAREPEGDVRAAEKRARFLVEVWNGSGNSGAGQRVAEALRDGGFRVAEVRNADRPDYGTTLVVDRKGNPGLAGEVVEYIRGGRPLLMRSAGTPADIRVIVGRDYAGLRLTP